MVEIARHLPLPMNANRNPYHANAMQGDMIQYDIRRQAYVPLSLDLLQRSLNSAEHSDPGPLILFNVIFILNINWFECVLEKELENTCIIYLEIILSTPSALGYGTIGSIQCLKYFHLCRWWERHCRVSLYIVAICTSDECSVSEITYNFRIRILQRGPVTTLDDCH